MWESFIQSHFGHKIEHNTKYCSNLAQGYQRTLPVKLTIYLYTFIVTVNVTIGG